MSRTISAAAAALRSGRTTAHALVEESLAAIGVHNGPTNAFITVDAEGARAAAGVADREQAAGIDRGPLHGIPISLKDLIDVAGVVTTAGSRVLANRIATADAIIVTRLRAAGAIVIGRTNLHEFAMGTTSEDSAFGPVRHPLDRSRFAGGSSGGSAAAVATGMGFASIGTDTGGSVRIPAALCGVVGLKPAFGEVPTAGIIPLSRSLDTAGPIARDVQDAAWVYAVLAHRPPFSVAPRTAAGLRLQHLVGYFDHLAPDVRAAWDGALVRLSSAGVEIAPGEIEKADEIASTYLHISLPEAAHAHAAYLDSQAGEYTPPVRARIASGRDTLATSYVAAHESARLFQQRVDAALEHCDALLLPAQPLVAQPIGTTDVTLGLYERDTVPLRGAMLKHTQLFNLTGHPAITLPVPVQGLPVGLQLVGRRDGTVALLSVAGAVEQVLSGAL